MINNVGAKLDSTRRLLFSFLGRRGRTGRVHQIEDFIMTLTDAYTAGLFDGEGTVTMAHRSSGEWKAPAVQLSSTSIELLQFLKQHYGGFISKIPKRESHHKQAWVWSCIYVRAIAFLTHIYPYVKEAAKRKRIKLLIEEYPKVTKRNGQYSDEEKRQKRAFENEFFRKD